ncbi:DUF455 family protein [Halobacteriovorax sp. HLS]|uniref:DUF455 family protein n=1 Tax=Halobacteriovorax sp. HLS TaxID=2234000 RepID=UPI000FD97DE8|nr:DUF455 family protein [Halobacteriovorax sp. HLS]
MNIDEYAKNILFSKDLDDKLQSPSIVTSCDDFEVRERPSFPARADNMKFRKEQTKFPKAGSLHIPEKRAITLHFFANHELLAIEMMAAAILCLPNRNEEDLKAKKGLLATIADEQKHFLLYKKRMESLGLGFGEVSLNSFFWNQYTKAQTLDDFFSIVSLTFEGANLDFANFYSGVFEDIEDFETKKIVDIVYEDEISHVAYGRNWLNKWKGDKSLWEYYLLHLPENLSPARAKGMQFDHSSRIRAGLDNDFISNVEAYRDDFSITDRKQWKS